MKVVLVLDKSHDLFLNSFKVAFAELHMQLIYFRVDVSKEYNAQRQQLLKMLDEVQANRLLVLNNLHKESNFFITEEVTRKIDCYLWFVDSFKLVKEKDASLYNYKKIFSFEPNDISYGKEHFGIKIKYVPLTAGYSIFCRAVKPIRSNKYDGSFVGLAAGLPKRLTLLNDVAIYCKKNNLTMAAYGHYWHNHYKLQHWIGALKFWVKYPSLYLFVKNRRISPEESADLYAETKVNLNIHQGYHTGFNCRTFEIMGGGNFLLCDKQNAELIPLKDRKHIAFYNGAEDLIKKLDYYLKHDEERNTIAIQGQNFVNGEYSFVNSLKTIFENDI